MVKVMKLKQGVYFNDDTGDRVRGRVELQGTISGLYVIRGPRDRLYVRSESNLKRIKPKKKAPSRPVRKVKAKKKAVKKRR